MLRPGRREQRLCHAAGRTAASHGQEATAVAAAYFSAISTIYAVVPGLMLYDVWNQFQDAARDVELEATSLSQIVRLTSAYPGDVQSEMRAAVHDYATAMIDQDWVAMQKGQEAQQAVNAYRRIWTHVLALNPTTPIQSAMYSQTLQAYTEFMRYRRLRHLRATEGLPAILWIVLWAGAFITIGFSCLFGLDDTSMHNIKVCALASMVSIVVLATWEIYGPFQGMVTVGPAPFQSLLNGLQTNLL